jgi:phosphatidylglycerol lysyltransferase
MSYPAFLSVYLLAAVASVCSHVPGGVGVFDLVMIKVLNHGDPHGMLAALLAYRAVYYLLPLAVGLCLFAAHEFSFNRQARPGEREA